MARIKDPELSVPWWEGGKAWRLSAVGGAVCSLQDGLWTPGLAECGLPAGSPAPPSGLACSFAFSGAQREEDGGRPALGLPASVV